MRKPTHATAGIATGLTASFLLMKDIDFETQSIIVSSILLGTSFIGSVFPDIDHPNSYIGRKFRITSFIVSKVAGHRGATHSPLILFLLCGLLMFLSKNIIPTEYIYYAYLAIGGFFAGTMSHVFLDALNKKGIPLFYPFSNKSFRFFITIKYDGLLERVFMFFMWIYMIWFVGVQIKIF